MIKVLFVCLGNICRSPMAEVVFKDMVKKKKLENKILVDSCATSSYEAGNSVHYGTKSILEDKGLSVEGMFSRQIIDKDLDSDYIVCMDSSNYRNVIQFIDGRKSGEVKKLLEYANINADIADPYYCGGFDITYRDVYKGCEALLNHIISKDF